jgi:hypothetical protein
VGNAIIHSRAMIRSSIRQGNKVVSFSQIAHLA